MVIRILLLLSSIGLTSAATCCPDLGCFAIDEAFRHLPAPSCVDVMYGMFTRRNSGDPPVITRDEVLAHLQTTSKRAIFVVHGYHNSMETEGMLKIKDALLERQNDVVFVVDWKEGASKKNYLKSASNTRVVGAEIAALMDALRDEAGFFSSQFWCIGFSLGAHACGFAGKSTHIGRITGLDPAGPSFKAYSEEARLSPESADLVDVIHTDGDGMLAYYGLMKPIGHMDFYPNGGAHQPGCWTDLGDDLDLDSMELRGDVTTMDADPSDDNASMCCSHSRAVTYFIQSIKNPYCFVSREICTDPQKLPRSCSSCSGGACGVMGYSADESPRQGIFYLETGSKSPYCRY